MRIVYTSDLHVDAGPGNAALAPHLAARAAALRPDVLIVAGDVADTEAGVRSGLLPFAVVPGRRLYVPGNHDLYVEGAAALGRGATSREKYASRLPEAAAAAGFTFLGPEPVFCGGVAFVGTPGWSDYSLRDPALDGCVHLDHYRNGVWRGQRAFDRGRMLWPADEAAASSAGAQPAACGTGWADDAWLTDFFLARLDAALEPARSARALVGVVHVLPCAAAVQRGVFGPSAFHDAYLGSVRFGERLRQEPTLRAIVTGHLHRSVDLVWEGVPVVARPVGRVRQTHDAALEAAARAGVGVLEIE